MFRYFATLWDTGSVAQRSLAREVIERLSASDAEWKTVCRAEGLQILCAGARSDRTEHQLLSPRHGAVLGSLFQRRDYTDYKGESQIAELDEIESRRITQSEGRHLIDAYWGAYIAIMRTECRGSIRIVRSPAGHLPCLFTSYQDVQFCFSFLPDFASLRLIDLTINWKFIAKLLTKSTYTEETGFNEVSQIRAGECLKVNHGATTRTLYWNPLDVVHSQLIERSEYAAQLLFHTTNACVHAWASSYRSVLHNLSGGLDSSIVAACLRTSPNQPRITFVNHYSEGLDCDERAHALRVARHCGSELVEHLRNADIRFEDALQADISERPRAYTRRLELAGFEAQLARDKQARAIFCGEKGDQLFYKNCPQLAAADYVRLRGLRPGLLDVVLNASDLEGVNFWTILRDALVQGLTARHWDPEHATRQDHPLVNPHVLAEYHSESNFPPWHDKSGKTPIGKQYQIYSLMNPEEYYPPFATPEEPERISPLLSQPLIELCLRIPTYILTSNCRDRSLARQAFIGHLPPETLSRRSKGGMSTHMYEIVRRNLTFTRDLMLNGGLAREGLLSRAKLEDALSGRPSAVLKGTGKLFQYISMELWLTVCTRSVLRIAA